MSPQQLPQEPMCRVASCYSLGEGWSWGGVLRKSLVLIPDCLAFAMRKGQGPQQASHQDKESRAISAFPMLLLLFGKEVATVVVLIALGHFSPLLLLYVYDSGVYF